MSATAVREKCQTTLPPDVCDAAGIKPNDQIDWRFEDGEIKGKKLVPDEIEEIGLEDVDPKTLLPKGEKIDIASLGRAIRADRDSR